MAVGKGGLYPLLSKEGSADSNRPGVVVIFLIKKPLVYKRRPKNTH